MLVGLPLALQAGGAAFDALAQDGAERGQSWAAASSSSSTKLALLSEQELLRRVANQASQGELVSLVRRALVELPLNPQAFWVMGSIAKTQSVRGIASLPSPDSADALFLAGSTLSRRHGGIALEELQSSARGGDLKKTLLALDRMLLVFPDHKAQLELLAGQLGDPELRQVLVTYARRPWFGGLLRSGASEQGDPSGAAILLAGSGLSVNELKPGLLPALLTSLTAKGDVQTAQMLTERMGANLSPKAAGFGLDGSGGDQRFAPLAWSIKAPAALGASSEHAAVSAELLPGVRAVLLERVTNYAPGSYRLSLTVSDDSLSETPELRWELECLESGKWHERWGQSIPPGSGLRRYAMNPSWTASCAAQRWRLRAGPVENQVGASLRLTKLALAPIN